MYIFVEKVFVAFSCRNWLFSIFHARTQKQWNNNYIALYTSCSIEEFKHNYYFMQTFIIFGESHKHWNIFAIATKGKTRQSFFCWSFFLSHSRRIIQFGQKTREEKGRITRVFVSFNFIISIRKYGKWNCTNQTFNAQYTFSQSTENWERRKKIDRKIIDTEMLAEMESTNGPYYHHTKQPDC